MCLGVQLLLGDSGFPSDAQGHKYLMLHIPPLYITSWVIGYRPQFRFKYFGWYFYGRIFIYFDI